MTAVKFKCPKCGYTKTYDVKIESDTGSAVGYPEECPECGSPDIEDIEFGPEDIPDVSDLYDYYMDKKGMADEAAYKKAVEDVNRARAKYGLSPIH